MNAPEARLGTPTGPVLWGVFALLLAAAAVPVFSTVLPPIFDYPNHLARMYLLSVGGDRFYAVRWAALPNLAEDLIVPPLARLMPLALAAKLFVIATFTLLAGGVIWLNRVATGQWRWWPLAAFLFLYTRTLLWGFLNYLFGVGCALCGAALWLTLEDRRASMRVLASSIAALICFFSHLAAFAIYGLTIIGVELPPALAELRARRWRALARRLAILTPQFLVPGAVFLFLSPHQPGGAIAYGAIWRKADLLFSVFDNYNRSFDIVCFAAFSGLVIALAVTRRLGFERRLGCAVGLLAAFYLLLPSQILAGSAADHRLPVAGFLLFVAASAPRFPSRRAAVAAGAFVAAMLVARMAVIEDVWRAADRVYTAVLDGLDRLPRGAALALAHPPSAVNMVRIPLLHVATLAIVRREAFVPTLFAVPGQQPVELRPPYAALAAATSPTLLWTGLTGGDAAARDAAFTALAGFEYVALTDRQPVQVPPSGCLTPVFRQKRFQIFAVSHGGACGPPRS